MSIVLIVAEAQPDGSIRKATFHALAAGAVLAQRIASRSAGRLKPSFTASSRSAGKQVPRANSPVRMAASMAAAACSARAALGSFARLTRLPA